MYIEDIKEDSLWLMKGDCLERMQEIPDGSVDLILTDPPYEISNSSGGMMPLASTLCTSQLKFGPPANSHLSLEYPMVIFCTL